MKMGQQGQIWIENKRKTSNRDVPVEPNTSCITKRYRHLWLIPFLYVAFVLFPHNAQGGVYKQAIPSMEFTIQFHIIVYSDFSHDFKNGK